MGVGNKLIAEETFVDVGMWKMFCRWHAPQTLGLAAAEKDED